MNYNPSAPGITGLQWRVRSATPVAMTPGGPGIGIVVDSTTTQVITSAAFDGIGFSTPGRYACDVYDITAGYPAVGAGVAQLNVVASWESWNNYNTQSLYTAGGASPNICENPPANDANSGGANRSHVFLGTPSQRSEYVTLRDFNYVPGIRLPGEVAASYKFNSPTLGTLAGRRIEWVGASTIVAQPGSYPANVALGIQPLHGAGDNVSWRNIGLIASSYWYNAQLFSAKWLVSPETRVNWTLNEVLSFAGTLALANSGFSIWMRGTATGGVGLNALYIMQFYELQANVGHTPETRVAAGVSPLALGRGWTQVPLTGPAGSGSFNKLAGRKYLFVFRSVIDSGGDIVSGVPWGSQNYVRTVLTLGTVLALDSGDVVAGSGGGSYDMPLSAAGVPSATPTQNTRTPAVALLAGGGASVDSQVYGGIVAHTVSTVGVSAQQDLRYTGGTLTFAGVRAMLGWENGVEPTQSLLVRIVNRGTSAVYATGSITVAQVRNGTLTSGQASDTRISLTDSTPTSPPINTQLFVEFYTATAGSTWQVYGVHDGYGAGLYMAQGYGGNTDTARSAGAAIVNEDLLVTIAQQPATPTLAVPIIV